LSHPPGADGDMLLELVGDLTAVGMTPSLERLTALEATIRRGGGPEPLRGHHPGLPGRLG
jgi:hypothetical protein